MAKKGKPTFMTKQIVDTIRKINARLKASYAEFGYSGDYSTIARKTLSSRVPMTKSGLISTAAKGYNESTIDDTVAWLSTIPTVSYLKEEAKVKLKGIYEARAIKYKKPVEEITDEALVNQVNAEFFLLNKTQDEFEQYYELWKNKDAGKIYDKALETKLDEMFRVGSKHIWSDAEYAEAFSGLKEFTKLLEAF